jgi:heat shock protein 5
MAFYFVIFVFSPFLSCDMYFFFKTTGACLCLLLFSPFLTVATAKPTASDNAPSSGPIIGIDLGTTYSCVAAYKDGNVNIIANDQGNRITPSYVAFAAGSQEDQRLVGDAAKNQASINPVNTVFDVKRLIGRNFSDKTVQDDSALLPYTIVNRGGKPYIQVKDKGELASFTPEEISSMVLNKLKETAEAFLGEEVKRAVITVPAYFNEAQKQATIDAGKIAGLQVERIITEPTAAAIAYGLSAKGKSSTRQEQTVLVYDLGGGTFDVTLLNIDDGVYEVLSHAGDTHLGGEDFDQNVMKYFMDLTKQKSGVDIAGNSKATQRLRKEVERVKRALSSQPQARLEIEGLIDSFDLVETLTRAKFEQLNLDLFQKTIRPLKRVLDDANLTVDDVDEIVMVGGSTRIPKVRQMISDLFKGQELHTDINPDEAVAYGAAVQGAVLAGTFATGSEILVIDATPLSLGIETAGGVMTNIISRGTAIPVKKTQTFSTNADNQSTVRIQVHQGERTMAKDNFQLGNFDLTGVPLAPRGVPQIEVTFEVDANGILQVSAADKGTGKTESVVIKADKGRLSQDDIDAMIEEATKHAEEDKAVKDRIDAKNGLESYVYGLRSTLEEKSGSLNGSLAEELKDVEDTMDETLDWIETFPEYTKDEIDGKLEELKSIVNPFLRSLYGGASAGESDESGDTDYYDGEL